MASTPYQAYSGELVAPVNSQQQAGIGNINANAGFASPYIQQAGGLATASSAPIDASTIQQYQNPYTQQVIDATMAQMSHDNASAMANLQGNQIAQGALGGNATGVAKGILAGQQNRTAASTVAGLYNQSYQQALQAAQEQQRTGLAGANSLANFGISGQNAALSGANAQIAAGGLLQNTQQAQDAAAYGQFTQQQAYPYQQLQWLAGLGTGVGSNLGGTSSGTTTGPAPNQTAQYLGAGLSLAGMFLARGGRIHKAGGGGIAGTPWADAQGWIPTMQIHGGPGAPHGSAPGLSNTQSGFDPSKMAQGITDFGSKMKGLDWGGAWNAGLGNLSGDSWGGGSFRGGDAFGGSSEAPLPGLSAADYGEGFARGGGVAGYALGGSPTDEVEHPDLMEWLGRQPSPSHEPSFQDRWNDRIARRDAPITDFEDRAGPTKAAIAGGDFDPQGANSTTFEGTPGMQAANRGYVPMPAQRPEAAPDAPDDGEDETPATGVAGAGRPPGAPVMAFAPEGQPGAYRQLPDAITRPHGDDTGFGFGLLPKNVKTGLLTAGLGMLASRSPFLGNAVGEGGLAGVHAYSAAEKADHDAAIEAEKLRREAENTAFSNQLNLRKQDESERHNVATEKQAAINADRTKWVPAGQYMGEDGIYRPVVMNSSNGEMKDPVTGKKVGPDAKIVGAKDSGFTDDEAKDIARRYVASGNKSVMVGIGQAARLKVARAIKGIQNDMNISDEELAQREVEFEGRKAGSRTLGIMESKMGSAAIEAEGAIKQARGVIERLPRTSFLPFNRLIQGYETNTLNPDQAELYGRTQAIVNTYAAVMARGANVTTDSSRHHAEALLNTAGNADTYNRMLDTMLAEIEMAKQSPARMQEFYRKHYGPKSVEQGNGSAGSPQVPPGASGTPRRVKQNGYIYEQQPDGSMKPIGPAQP